MAQKKRLSRLYMALVSNISEAIYKYDPDGLSIFGAPKDEYDAEAMRVAARLKHAEDEDGVKNILLDVLGEAFDLELDAHSIALETTARDVWKIWQNYLGQIKEL